MANPYFEPGAERATKVRELFGRIARRYDFLNDLQSFGLHRLWKRRLVRMSAVTPGLEALDVCCGTGDLALAMARAGARVTGVDFSREMLDVAGNRWKASTTFQAPTSQETSNFKLQTPNESTAEIRAPKLVLGDAQELPFPQDSFDVVTVGYGLRNLADLEKGLRELQRVLRPGGRLLILDFGKPENALWRRVYFGYLRLVVPAFGLLFCGSADAYAYILESLKAYPGQRGVAEKMKALGLVNAHILEFLGGAMSINYGEKAKFAVETGLPDI